MEYKGNDFLVQKDKLVELIERKLQEEKKKSKRRKGKTIQHAGVALINLNMEIKRQSKTTKDGQWPTWREPRERNSPDSLKKSLTTSVDQNSTRDWMP